MPPEEFAPTRGDQLSWAAWGDHYETEGQTGEKPDWPPAIALLDLAKRWEVSTSDAERQTLWQEILDIHAAEIIHIGTVAQVRQPIVVKGLANVPEDAIFGWDPGAHFGIHRMDEFWIANRAQ